ncbi:MAG: PQQ-dependent sugar dehydrogenase [Alphaproteobacteria bacterium]|nr:PQQ-dependent sugar dehydrogenase [Alphaproteobacteria bacterium]
MLGWRSSKAAVCLLLGWAALAPSGASAQQSGQRLYEQICAACHEGGDETAPERKELAALAPERIIRALSPGGLMAGPGGRLAAGEREAVAAFLTRAPQPAATASREPLRNDRSNPDLYVDGIPYPARRIADPRDSAAARRAPAWPAPPLEKGVYKAESWEERNLQITVMATGLSSPRAIEFLPGGEMLITERAGALRILRNGVLDPEPVRGTPTVAVLGTATGFMDIELHPRFSENGLIYLSYHKPAFGKFGVNAIFRGRWNGREIVDGKDIFLSDDVDALYSRLHFGPDGKLYATIGCPGVGTDESISRAQDTADYAGKTLRLNDDGTTPSDNPFAGVKGYNPEIYTLGHRVNLGLALNPWTQEFWVSEHGPQGGDEINILRPGLNYGWPIISDGRYYSGRKVSEIPYRDGLTRPHISYVPSIAPGGMVFYTGDRFPAWKGNLFVGSMRMSNAPRTGHLERIVFNDKWEVVRSEMLLVDFHQRIRDVEQGPDGALYVITDEGTSSVVMKIEPGAASG